MSELAACESCGMPMETAEMHGGGVEDNPYCVYCTDARGDLKPKADVREGMIQFYMDTMGKSRTEAQRVVDATMAEMPAWKGT
jgi:hypothetical protein